MRLYLRFLTAKYKYTARRPPRGRGTALAVEGASRYGKLRLILLYRALLQSSTTTAPSRREPSFYPFFCEKKLPQTDYCENKIIMQTIPQSSSMTAPFTQGSLRFDRYLRAKAFLRESIIVNNVILRHITLKKKRKFNVLER